MSGIPSWMIRSDWSKRCLKINARKLTMTVLLLDVKVKLLKTNIYPDYA